MNAKQFETIQKSERERLLKLAKELELIWPGTIYLRAAIQAAGNDGIRVTPPPPQPGAGPILPPGYMEPRNINPFPMQKPSLLGTLIIKLFGAGKKAVEAAQQKKRFDRAVFLTQEIDKGIKDYNARAAEYVQQVDEARTLETIGKVIDKPGAATPGRKAEESNKDTQTGIALVLAVAILLIIRRRRQA